MTPWLLSESQRLTTCLGAGHGKGQKLDLGPFWVFLPLLGATAVVNWLATSAAPELEYGVSLLSIVVIIGGGCLALQHEYRPSLRQFGLQLGVFTSAATRRWTLLAVATSAVLRTVPLVVAHFRDPSVPRHLDPDVQQAWGHLPSFVVLGILLVPIVEELGFRGYLYLALRQNWGENAAALLTSAVFAVVHLRHLPVYFCISIVDIFFNNRARSLWPSIAGHIVWNAGVLTFPPVPGGG